MSTAPATASARLPLPVRRIDARRPLAWLELGYRDLLAAPGPSLLHGLLIALGGLAILTLTLTLRAWLLMPGALSGFVLVGPILATGLYELSRRRTLGERPRLAHAIAAWRRGTRPLVLLGVLLFCAGTAWVLASALLFRLFVSARIASPLDFLRYAAADQGALAFWLWVLAGGLGAAFVFALTVVAAPLLLDRAVGVKRAALTSVRAVGDNPLPMALWAALIMALSVLSLATLMIGFVFTVPIIGHATWHAYRELVDADAAPPRV